MTASLMMPLWALGLIACVDGSLASLSVPKTVDAAVRVETRVLTFAGPTNASREVLAALPDETLVYRDGKVVHLLRSNGTEVLVADGEAMDSFQGAFARGSVVTIFGKDAMDAPLVWSIDENNQTYKPRVAEAFVSLRPERVVLETPRYVFLASSSALLRYDGTEVKEFRIANVGAVLSAVLSIDAYGGFSGFVGTQKGLLSVRFDERGFALLDSFEHQAITHLAKDELERIWVRDADGAVSIFRRGEFVSVFVRGYRGIVAGTGSSVWLLPESPQEPNRWVYRNEIRPAAATHRAIGAASGGLWVQVSNTDEWQEWSLMPRLHLRWATDAPLRNQSGCFSLGSDALLSFGKNSSQSSDAMSCSVAVGTASPSSPNTQLSLNPQALGYGRKDFEIRCPSASTEFDASLSFCVDVRFTPTWFGNIRALVADKCLSCHGPRQNDQCNAVVPCVPLSNPSDWQTHGARAVSNVMADSSGLIRMPPSMPMTLEEQEILKAWHEAGMPLGEGTETSVMSCGRCAR